MQKGASPRQVGVRYPPKNLWVMMMEERHCTLRSVFSPTLTLKGEEHSLVHGKYSRSSEQHS